MDALTVRRAIERKRDGEELPPHTWRALIDAFATGAIDDAPMASLAMACVLKGLGERETLAITEAMVASGDVLELDGYAIDKHSSGGVGDTVSLIVVPVVAACGVRVAKLSGRALGHTGGTLDKLEAIPGVRTDLDPADFAAIVDRVGCAIGAQSAKLVPADKRLYALRDRTGTVPSIGLIASSIVSKKIAGGAKGIVYDVKVGGGAFLEDEYDAFALGRALVDLTERFDRNAVAVVTDMDEPLSPFVGSGIEAIAAREFLAGRFHDERLRALVDAIAGVMLALGGVDDGEAARAIDTGAAYECFVAMLEAQGGTRAAFEAMRPHERVAVVTASHDGYVERIEAVAVGEIARTLVTHAGPVAGVELRVHAGDRVTRGAEIARLYGGTAALAEEVARAIPIGDDVPERPPLIAGVVPGQRPFAGSERTGVNGSSGTSVPSRTTSAMR